MFVISQHEVVQIIPIVKKWQLKVEGKFRLAICITCLMKHPNMEETPAPSLLLFTHLSSLLCLSCFPPFLMGMYFVCRHAIFVQSLEDMSKGSSPSPPKIFPNIPSGCGNHYLCIESIRKLAVLLLPNLTLQIHCHPLFLLINYAACFDIILLALMIWADSNSQLKNKTKKIKNKLFVRKNCYNYQKNYLFINIFITSSSSSRNNIKTHTLKDSK